jgi:hypothetical protein
MLIFRRGKWHAIQILLSDPMLTEGHKWTAAALVANGLVKGASVETATAAAEKTLYEKIYGAKNLSGRA